jgi:hypothetical protein
VAIGNGRNDGPMLAAAGLDIAVTGPERAFSALLAALGAVMFVGGALLAKLADLLVLWGVLLLTFGGTAVIRQC